jgi:hypothetical protein
MTCHIKLCAKLLLLILVFACAPTGVAAFANEAQDATQSTGTRETAKTKTTKVEDMGASLTIEGDMEEIMGEVQETFQGSKVDVMTGAQVAKWLPKWRLEEQIK